MGVVIVLDKDSYMPITEEMIEKANRELAKIVYEMMQAGELPELEVKEAG